MDYSKLLGRMREKSITQEALAETLGVTRQSISNKVTGKVAFSQKDIIQICNALEIPPEDVGLYFFSSKVTIS